MVAAGSPGVVHHRDHPKAETLKEFPCLLVPHSADIIIPFNIRKYRHQDLFKPTILISNNHGIGIRLLKEILVRILPEAVNSVSQLPKNLSDLLQHLP